MHVDLGGRIIVCEEIGVGGATRGVHGTKRAVAYAEASLSSSDFP